MLLPDSVSIGLANRSAYSRKIILSNRESPISPGAFPFLPVGYIGKQVEQNAGKIKIQRLPKQ
jgi:hypothetical protein